MVLIGARFKMSTSAKLTLLTDPIPVGKHFWLEKFRFIVRAMHRNIKKQPSYLNTHYRGHLAVTRSVVEGLKKVGASFTYNPRSLRDIAETVVVLSGIRTLRQAILLKRRGVFKRLIAGTNVMILPSDYPDICKTEVDLYITPSEWVCTSYVDDCPELRGRCLPWPAGVDTDYWSPKNRNKELKRALIFGKHNAGPIPAINDYKNVLEKRGYEVNILKRDGRSTYTPEGYRSLLQESSILVGFSRSESQGLAWVEAWSVDVPTFIWRNNTNTINGRTFDTSSAPYLAEQNGCFFDDLKDFEQLLTDWEFGNLDFSPRQWVLDNMSDEVCVRKLCRLAEI